MDDVIPTFGSVGRDRLLQRTSTRETVHRGLITMHTRRDAEARLECATEMRRVVEAAIERNFGDRKCSALSPRHRAGTR